MTRRRTLRIALVHSFYRSDQPSGENTIVQLQREALARRGHTVLIVARHSDELTPGAAQRVRVAWQVAAGNGGDPTAELRRFAPDVVHVHNLFPNYATRWLEGWRGPLVATVHNFRPICANALLYRDGGVCTLCPDGQRWAGVRHACYRGSRVASAPIAWRNRHGVAADPLLRRADRVIFLSERAARLYARYGGPTGRSVVLPNGIPDPRLSTASSQTAGQRPDGWVAIGRFSAEKGFVELLDQWPAGFALDVIGAGPLRSQLDAITRTRTEIRLLGSVEQHELWSRLRQCAGAVVPGVNVESAYPLVAVEALACGVPLVAREGGAAAEMVQAWGGGFTYRDRSSLSAALSSSRSDSSAGLWARQVYLERFSEERWVDGLEDLYRDVVSAAG